MSWLLMSKQSIKTPVQIVSVDDGRDGQRLDNFLAGRLKGVPRSLIYRLIRTGQVRINGGRAKPATRLQAGDKVRIPPARMAGDTSVTLPDWAIGAIAERIIHEQDELLVLNKPAGMAVHSGSGLSWGVIDVLRHLRPNDEFELVHRLDRDTSGCLLLACGGKALRQLGAQFRSGEIGKRYLCLLDGRLQQARVEVDQPIARSEYRGERQMIVAVGGKDALTTFRLLEHYGKCSFAEAELHTGRSHQIRVHAQWLELSLAGEDRYASRKRAEWWLKKGLARIFLHAHQIQIPRQDGDPLLVNAPLPDELRRVLDSLAAEK
jgi:23S rRNA pseudouridine955/2504/2580 synthase